MSEQLTSSDLYAELRIVQDEARKLQNGLNYFTVPAGERPALREQLLVLLERAARLRESADRLAETEAGVR
jgi:hypothetical protein